MSKIGGKTVGIIIAGMEGRPPRPGRGGSTADGPPRPTGRPGLKEVLSRENNVLSLIVSLGQAMSLFNFECTPYYSNHIKS